jgi:uncharacterized integral membrane protein
MLKLLRTLLALVGAALIVTFSVANRGPVEISFWPLPFTNTLPLYAVLLMGVVLGIVLGAVATWLSGHARRVAYRDLRRRVAGLEYRERMQREAESQAAADRVRERSAVHAPAGPPARAA